ncbi:MAG: S1 RNA-binding domain-containing protein [Phycisphaerales bacterium]|nr:S1 RNA-binding domain-containing protein [Planctomycetota bacterium]
MSTSNTPSSRPNDSAPTGVEADLLGDDLNAEIDAAMAQLDREADALSKQADKKAERDRVSQGRPAHIRGPRLVQAGREHRSGQVVSVGPTDIFLEFGPKELGIVPRVQFPEPDVPKVGDTIEVVVDKFEAGESLFVCSRPGAVQKADWELLESGQVVEARVSGVATGKDGKQVGLELEVAGHRAFMPASQVALDRVPDFSVFVGEKMNCTVVRVERVGKGNIVLSRRDVLNTERKRLAEETKKNLAEGATVEGIVRKIMPFGAFVDIGGVDGLIHISDLSYDKIGFGEKAVEKHVKEGQRVTVRVLKVELENNRISLGLKQVQGDPFATAATALTEGAEVTGKVTKLLEFGAFVEVAAGVEGLVHISEIDHKRIGKVEDALKVDEVVRCKILKIDPGSRRISLSIKALKPLPEVKIQEGGPQQGQAGEARGRGRGGPGGQGGGAGFGGGGRGFGGGGKAPRDTRTAEEILKETPALRRMREQSKKIKFKGGLG